MARLQIENQTAVLGDVGRYPARRNRIEPPLSLAARPYFKRVGICCTLFFGAMGSFSVWAAVTNAGGGFANPIMDAVMFGAFWSAFTLLGFYLWVFSHKYRLAISEDAIEQRGVFTERKISFRNIENAQWRNWPKGGSIKLIAAMDQMSIELGTTNSRDSIIEILRAKLPTNIQSGWETFVYNNEKPNATKTISPFWLGMIFHGFAVSFLVAWFMGIGGVNLIIVALINCGFATFLMTRKSQGNNAMNRSREAERL